MFSVPFLNHYTGTRLSVNMIESQFAMSSYMVSLPRVETLSLQRLVNSFSVSLKLDIVNVYHSEFKTTQPLKL